MRILRRLLPPILLGIALVALYLVGRAALPPARQFLMPAPFDIWTEAFANPAVRADLGRRILVTGGIALSGLAASIAIGVALGIAMFRWSLVERAIAPYLVVLQSVPILAITPLLQVGLGYGTEPKVIIAFILSFFSIPTTLLLGLKSIDRGLLDLFRLQKTSWWVMLWKLGLPAALPTLFAGLRIAAGLAVIGAITGELFFQTGSGGLGQLLINAKINFEYPVLYAALITSSLMSVAVFLGFAWLGQALFAAWHETGPAGSRP